MDYYGRPDPEDLIKHNSNEIKKSKGQPAITQEEIDKIDWDDLLAKLQSK